MRFSCAPCAIAWCHLSKLPAAQLRRSVGRSLFFSRRVRETPLPDTAPKKAVACRICRCRTRIRQKMVACRIRRCRTSPRQKPSRAVDAAAGHRPENSRRVRYPPLPGTAPKTAVACATRRCRARPRKKTVACRIRRRRTRPRKKTVACRIRRRRTRPRKRPSRAVSAVAGHGLKKTPPRPGGAVIRQIKRILFYICFCSSFLL